MKFELEHFDGVEKDGFYVQSLMRRVWAAQIEVLKEIDKICERHNLKYIAQWGTLLGAIRHKGFIPWDDDIDLAMLRGDYEKFIYYAKRELPEGWLLYDCREEGFDDLLVRVINSFEIKLEQTFLERFRGCPFVIGVDIFPMDHIPDDEGEEETLINMMTMLDSVGVNWKKYEEEPEGIEPILQDIEEITGIHFDRSKNLQKQVLNLADRASAMYWDEPTENVAMVYRLAQNPQNKFPRSYFDNIIRVPFEDTTVPVVAEYDLMLRKYLGDDYMSPRIWASHDYPFFKKQINNLKEFFEEHGMTLPTCYDMYSRENGKPIVSVIIPCYNVEKYIDRCLKSLMCQTVSVTSIEIICVDDASTDGTRDVLAEWERVLGNVLKVIHCETNGKQGTARNVGLEYAEADYVAFIDADDWVEKDYIEKLYEPTKMADFDVVTCALRRDPSDSLTYFEDRSTGRESRSLVIDSVEKRKTFLNIYACGHSVCHKIIRRELLTENEIYCPEQLAYEDAYFETLLHFYASKVYVHEEQLYHYYVNKSSTVLTKQADYHADWLTVHLMKWQTWKERGFLEEYREELEYEFLWSCYLGYLKLLALRFEVPSYSQFMLLKEITLVHVPDYTANKYTDRGFSEFQKVLLETLVLPVGREEFLQIIEMIKQHGV